MNERRNRIITIAAITLMGLSVIVIIDGLISSSLQQVGAAGFSMAVGAVVLVGIVRSRNRDADGPTS